MTLITKSVPGLIQKSEADTVEVAKKRPAVHGGPGSFNDKCSLEALSEKKEKGKRDGHALKRSVQKDFPLKTPDGTKEGRTVGATQIN